MDEPQMTSEELSAALDYLVESGLAQAALIGDEVRYFAPEHFPENAEPLSVEEVQMHRATGWMTTTS